jgi:hypothetical protein
MIESETLAYCYYNGTLDEWFNYCPECYTKYANKEKLGEPDAWIKFLNGDVMQCCICLQEIR